MQEFGLLLSNLLKFIQFKRKQNSAASLGIINSQSVKWGNNKSLNGIDGSKRVKGINCHVVVDKMDFNSSYGNNSS